MSVLVTGAAGFIGSHVCHALLARGETVTGIDCINDYYDVRLKEARLARLNIGNNNSEKLTDFIAALESALGIKAKMRFEPMQPGDVVSTYADIEDTKRDLGFAPTTPISVGVPKFVAWYREFYGV